MKPIELMYFSGTGNTEIAAAMIARNFRDRGCEVRMEKIGNEDGAIAAPDEAATMDAGVLGIGAPVVGLGTPSIVLKFIGKLPAGNGKKVFVFRTAGGVAPGNYNASRDMAALLKKKGYDVFHERLFSIGSNWVIRFSNEAMRKLRDATELRINAMCAEVLAGKKHFYETGKRKRAGDAILRCVSRIGLRLLSADFQVGATCTSCGLCARRCPSGNVRMKRGKPHFGASCAACMRCLYGCPQKAISMRSLGFLQVKGGYNVSDILEHPERWSDEGTKANPPFMAGYVENSQH